MFDPYASIEDADKKTSNHCEVAQTQSRLDHRVSTGQTAMTIPSEFLANGALAIVLLSFWFNHIQRYKWKLVKAIADAEFKIEKSKGESLPNTKFWVTQRIMLKNELYELQKLTNYSGFR